MFKQYEIMEIRDQNCPYRLKYRFMVLKYCGADSRQTPIYTIAKQFRNIEKATEYIIEKQKHATN